MAEPCGYHLVATSDSSSFLVVTMVQHGSRMRAAVFDSVPLRWRLRPWYTVHPPPTFLVWVQPRGRAGSHIYWEYARDRCMLELDTATMEFSGVALPPHGYDYRSDNYCIGETKDGRVCFVGLSGHGDVVLWLSEYGGSKHKWLVEKEVSLEAEFGRLTERVQYVQHDLAVDTVTNGIAHLRMGMAKVIPDKRTTRVHAWMLSLELQTMQVQVVHKDEFCGLVHMYMMAWQPPFLREWWRELLP